jgi:hypothetical protein
VQFVEGDIRDCTEKADRVICIGAEYAWGSLDAALVSLHAHVEPGGTLLMGTGFWSRPPSASLVQMFGELPTSCEAVLERARSRGWTVIWHDLADQQEWDEFESTWNEDLEETVRKNPDSFRRAQAQRLLSERRTQYVQGYRGVLGFAYLLLEKKGPNGTGTPSPG